MSRLTRPRSASALSHFRKGGGRDELMNREKSEMFAKSTFRLDKKGKERVRPGTSPSTIKARRSGPSYVIASESKRKTRPGTVPTGKTLGGRKLKRTNDRHITKVAIPKSVLDFEKGIYRLRERQRNGMTQPIEDTEENEEEPRVAMDSSDEDDHLIFRIMSRSLSKK